MASIMSTISAYFRKHHGNETYVGIFFHFTYVQKQRSKKHVPWKAPFIVVADIFFMKLRYFGGSIIDLLTRRSFRSALLLKPHGRLTERTMFQTGHSSQTLKGCPRVIVGSWARSLRLTHVKPLQARKEMFIW